MDRNRLLLIGAALAVLLVLAYMASVGILPP
jgi:hypothetical protein